MHETDGLLCVPIANFRFHCLCLLQETNKTQCQSRLPSMKLALLFCFTICCIYSGNVIGKECTNIPTQLSSHTLRYELLASKNTTWKEEVLSLYHLNHEEESTWLGLLPRKILRSESSNRIFDWAMLYRSIKWGTSKGADDQTFLKEISLHDVRLDPDSKHGKAQQTNLEYLLMLDVDRLVWSFRKQVGLPTLGEPYGGWEAPDVELRGHFVGHYMSATAKMWASTHNDSLRQKMTTVVDSLYECQKKTSTGYLSAFPSEFFDRFEAIKSVWAPYYTIHKIMAGLLDQYLFAGNSRALDMVVWMADYFGNRVKNVIMKYSIERHYLSLNEETGGMNDVLYNLYTVTGDQKHLVLAHLFDKPCFLGLLAVQADSISGFHANTHIPVVIGAQKRYEVTGDSLYKDIGTFFMDIVNSSHIYATGGTSVSEFWSNPKRLADTLQTENEESCTTYNMLKIARNLFRWTKEISYADYYERALTNGVLSIQRGSQPGIMIYMLPQGRGVSKARSYHRWGTPFNSFWCCYGTGIESFSKLGDSIYFEETGSMPTLYIIQFISSSLNWKSGGVALQQKVDPVTPSDPSIKVLFSFSANESAAVSSTLKLRVPFWTSLNGAAAEINGQKLDMASPGSFLSITKKWGNDVIALKLPLGLRTEAIQDDRSEYSCIQAILYGPYLLAGLSTGHWNIKAAGAKSMTDWIKAISSDYNSQLISLTQEFTNGSLILMNSNNSLVMDQVPEVGTDAAVHSTFRVIHTNSRRSHLSSRKIVGGEAMMLEPFDLPGAAVMYLKPESDLFISTAADSGNSLFSLITGLDGKPNCVSLESVNYPGCYIAHTGGRSVQLICEENRSSAFLEAACFTISTPMREYNPISFVARGAERNFILEPLLSLTDESYTVYFNITA